MADPFDVALEDSDLLVEVEMTTNLIIAATASDGPLPLDEIDRILGVEPEVGLSRRRLLAGRALSSLIPAA